MSLSKNSTLQEVFDFIRNDEADVQVQAVTLTEATDKHAELMLLIQGKADTAQHIMANLMTAVQDMHDLSEQRHVAPEQEEPQPAVIIGTDGEVLGDDGPELKIVQ